MPAPLNDDQIGKYLADPLSFPPEFKNWVVKYLEQHQPNLLIRQLVGTLLPSKIAGYPANAAKVLAGDGNWLGGVVTAFDTTLGAAAGTIDTLAVLPTTYAHMQVWFQGRGDTVANSTSLLFRANNDSTSGHYYDVHGQDTDTAHVSSGDVATTNTSALCGFVNAASATAAHPSVTIIDIPNYAGTTFTKPLLARTYGLFNSGTGNQVVRTMGGVWAVAATAINRITLLAGAGNFIAGSRMTVYVWGV